METATPEVKLAPTLSMIWDCLLFAAIYHQESSAAVDRAFDRAAPTLSAVDIEEVAEEMAREHFPSGIVGAVGWARREEVPGDRYTIAWCGLDSAARWSFQAASFAAMVSHLPPQGLSPQDPAHVAMVTRALALSLAMDCGTFPVGITITHNERWTEPSQPDEIGYMMRLILNGKRGPGHFFPYGARFEADVQAGEALFAWFMAHHTEITAAMATETS